MVNFAQSIANYDAAKKLALELAAAVPTVTGIVDRLKVTAAEHMTDEVIREHVRDAVIQEPAFSDCTVRFRLGERVTVRSLLVT